MDTAIYDQMRHFADSWGLVYMCAIAVGVMAFVLRPGAREAAQEAAAIPLNDTADMPRDE